MPSRLGRTICYILEGIMNINTVQVDTLKKIIEIIKKEFPDSEEIQREILVKIVTIQL